MHQTTCTNLRNNAKFYFDMVEAGKSVRVSRNGKPIADIVPIALELPSWKRRMAHPLVIAAASLSALIIADRN